MEKKRSVGLPIAMLLLASLAAAGVQAQSAGTPASRLAGDWRSTAAVAIPNSKPPANLAAANLGAAPSNQVLSRMLLLLAPAPAQQQALVAAKPSPSSRAVM